MVCGGGDKKKHEKMNIHGFALVTAERAVAGRTNTDLLTIRCTLSAIRCLWSAAVVTRKNTKK